MSARVLLRASPSVALLLLAASFLRPDHPRYGMDKVELVAATLGVVAVLVGVPYAVAAFAVRPTASPRAVAAARALALWPAVAVAAFLALAYPPLYRTAVAPHVRPWLTTYWLLLVAVHGAILASAIRVRPSAPAPMASRVAASLIASAIFVVVFVASIARPHPSANGSAVIGDTRTVQLAEAEHASRSGGQYGPAEGLGGLPVAVPLVPGRTGRRFFCGDDTGRVCVAWSPMPDAADGRCPTSCENLW